MNSSEMIDLVDHLYKAENLAQLLSTLADGLRDQPRLARGLGEVSWQIVDIVSEVRAELEAEIKRLADERAAA